MYITDPNARIAAIEDNVRNCIVIDPGRRDILYCMHKASSEQEPLLNRFTSNDLSNNSSRRQYRRIGKGILADNPRIQQVINLLSDVRQLELMNMNSSLE
jgi:hypothetical protein